MDSIIESIEEWLRGLLVSGIMSNLNNTFNSVNTQVGAIASEVGTTPASFSPAVFNMIPTTPYSYNFYPQTPLNRLVSPSKPADP